MAERGRDYRLGQDAKALAFTLPDRRHSRVPGNLKCFPSAHVAEIRDLLSAVGIVEIHQARLRMDTAGPQTGGMVRISFHFGRTPKMALDNDALCDTVHRSSSGIIFGLAWNHIFWRLHIRQIVSAGWRVQPVRPARASEPAMSERNRRRLSSESSTPSSENCSESKCSRASAWLIQRLPVIVRLRIRLRALQVERRPGSM